MKLRNKKTGEIDEFLFEVINNRIDLYRRIGTAETKNTWTYPSLTKLCEEWEDHEEPKEYCFINSCGVVEARTEEEQLAVADMHKQFGNYFETQEEAEKAVEKLKAWKQLKDKGFRFDKWENDKEKYLGDFVIYAHTKDLTDIVDDLDLLFGGEE